MLIVQSNYYITLQTMSISMYFGVSWLDPRLQINETAAEWTEVKTGPKDVSILFHSKDMYVNKSNSVV